MVVPSSPSEPSVSNTVECVVDPRPQIRGPKDLALWVFEEVRWTLRALISAADRFYWDNGFSKAASLAYTTLLSLVPLTALLFLILASFLLPAKLNDVADLGHHPSVSTEQTVPLVLEPLSPEQGAERLDYIRRFIFKQFLPNVAALDQVIDHLREASSIVAQLNMLAIFFLVLTSILLLSSIEAMLNEVWQVFESRSIVNRIKIFSSIILLAPVLFVSAIYFADFGSRHISSLGINARLYNYSFQFLIDFVVFFLLYYSVPRAPVKISSAAFGAFLSAVLFGLMKDLFVVYIDRFASYNKVYGSVAAIPIFLFWLYLFWSLVLYGAECSYQAQYLPRKGKVWKRTVLSVGDSALMLGMQALIVIGRSFQFGRRMPNDWEVAELLGCSSTVLKPILSALEKSGLLVRSERGSMPLTLLRSPEKISLLEIRQALAAGRTSVRYSNQLSKVFASYGNSDEGKLTLADVLRVSEKAN